MSSEVTSPFTVFFDRSGQPLDAGYIYIGTAGINPEVSPISVYWDTALTIPAAQPIRTLAGYPSRNGSPGIIIISPLTFSIVVRDRNGALVFSNLNATVFLTPSIFSTENTWTGRETYSASALSYNLAGNSQATILDFTTGADVTVPASKQADLIYFSDTYDIGSAGIVHLFNANIAAKATSHSSSNLRGPTITITNYGAGTTTGTYPRVIAGVGCTGDILAIKAGVKTITGIGAAYTRQITNDTDSSGTLEALDWWTSNTASATTANYGLLADVKLSVATSFIQYASVGAGAFLTQKNSTAAADLFKISSAGIITECKGATFNGAVTFNTATTTGSQIVHSFSNGTREFQAQAVTTGDFWRILVGGVGDGLKLFAGGLLQILGSVHAHFSTAIPAGGTAGAGLLVSSATNFGVFFGSGAPTLAAAQGSLYLRSDGSSTSNRAYINTDGGTTWTALTTAA